ncbi:hypothetical protein DFQ27_007778 [Actinomortierella ambigua]|uniref:Uncharacterized protein n=1 Tax=Actinomortierella ambigua TaxID=1343610 RepID=A0A9P6PSW5_9FUNG|nr:hypothetical protein DFQ27_007778 [Actinomortierella ambigua]
MQDEYSMESNDADSEWPLTQGGWLSYGESQEQIPLEQVPDPEREPDLRDDQEWGSDHGLDMNHNLGLEMEGELEDELGDELEDELDQELDNESQVQQDPPRSKMANASKAESTRGHLLPVFFQARSNTENIESFRKLHMEGLGQLLRRLLVRRELQTATSIFELLFDSKDTSEEFIWKIGLEFLYSMDMYDEQVFGFLSWLFSKTRFHVSHVTVAPYNKDPLIQGYAGIVKMLLLEKAKNGSSRLPWRIYARCSKKEEGLQLGPSIKDFNLNPQERDPFDIPSSMAWNEEHAARLSDSEGDWGLESLDEGEPSSRENDELLRSLIEVPLREVCGWTMDGIDDDNAVADNPDGRSPFQAPVSQSIAPDRLKQDAINHLEKSLELEPKNDEFLLALVDVRLGFLDYSNPELFQSIDMTPELQEAIVGTKTYLRKHLRRYESLKALHILASLEAITGSQEERITLLHEILWRDPAASTDDVVKPLIQYYWQQLTPEEARLVAAIEATDYDDSDDDDGSDSHSSHTNENQGNNDGSNSNRRRRHRQNMTYEDEDRELSEFEALLDEHGWDGPSAPLLMDILDKLSFLGRDKRMGKFEGQDRFYAFWGENGAHGCETQRRHFAWPGKMNAPDTTQEEVDAERAAAAAAATAEEGGEDQARMDKTRKEKRGGGVVSPRREPPQFEPQSIDLALMSGPMVKDTRILQLLHPTKGRDTGFHQYDDDDDDDDDDADSENAEDDEDGDEGFDPELLESSTKIATLKIIRKLNLHQPPVEPFRPILEILLRRAEFGTSKTIRAFMANAFETAKNRKIPHGAVIV